MVSISHENQIACEDTEAGELAEFNLELGNLDEASRHLLKALSLTQLESEQAFPGNKLKRCEQQMSRLASATAIGLI